MPRSASKAMYASDTVTLLSVIFGISLTPFLSELMASAPAKCKSSKYLLFPRRSLHLSLTLIRPLAPSRWTVGITLLHDLSSKRSLSDQEALCQSENDPLS